jgi:3-hydroxybutyryl-CoA dehydratase
MVNQESINMKKLENEDIYVGRKASISKTILDSDIYSFAGIVGDFNPLHVNNTYATEKMGGRIAHGMLIASFISSIMGMGFPTGGIFLEQTVKFKAPVRVNDTITAIGEIIDISYTKSGRRINTIEITISNQEGTVVLEGIGKTMSLPES